MKKLALALVVIAQSAAAQTKLNLLYTAAPSYLSAYVAQDQAMFASHGLAVTLTLSTNPSTVPAALVSNSSDIGGLQTITLLQAADQGLDLVTVAGTEAYPAPYHQGFLARKGSGISGLADLKGKRLGIPGLGATMDILARKMFQAADIADTSVIRVEVPLQQMADTLRGGSIDAVVAVDPTYSRIIDAGIGVPAGSWEGLIPRGTFLSLYVSDRAWASRHLETVKTFRAALDDATAFIRNPANAATVRDSMTRYTRLPASVVNSMALPASLTTRVTPAALAFWAEVGTRQGLLTHEPDLASLVVE